MIKTDKLIEKIWHSMDVPNDCGECEYLDETTDGFGTGDSPSVYECTVDSFECPKVKSAVIAAAEFMGVEQHECIFHKKQAM